LDIWKKGRKVCYRYGKEAEEEVFMAAETSAEYFS
jgi:hypothetical protein